MSEIRVLEVDVLIVGAGVSGIGMAARLVREKTGKSFTILERRERVGGTWDLFTYPGIRSDSDMYTFGYKFRPWKGTSFLAPGDKIRNYVEDTAREYGVLDRIRFGRRAVAANWSSADERWTVEVVNEKTGTPETYISKFLAGCTGYYNYDRGYRPKFPGEENFRGQFVHPQFWPEDLDYAGKNVVVIGSGATAVTLVPAMAPTAGHVTMLQRSPTYILPIPSEDPVAHGLRFLPKSAAVSYALGRPRQIAIQAALYQASRRTPEVVKAFIRKLNLSQLRGKVDIRHFTPNYEPWDQRLCVVPDGDLFKALRRNQASIVTDHIKTFTEDAIITESGDRIPADIVITATGLEVQALGGAKVYVDGEQLRIGDRMLYKGALVEGVPNAVVVLGYPNMSWTLKADLVSEYFCRLLKRLDEVGDSTFSVHARPEDRTDDTVFGSALKSGYVMRGAAHMPRQGKSRPWQFQQDYYLDAQTMRYAPLEDGVLEFSGSAASPSRRGRALSAAGALAFAPARWLSRRI